MNIITLLKISWRNVWRSKLRSLVVILSVVFGIHGGIIMIAMSYGLNEERMNNAVETYLSHIQIHNNLFREDYNSWMPGNMKVDPLDCFEMIK